jgi:hypothetical protein
MYRNIATILLVGTILYNNYKLSYIECVILFTIILFFAVGNLSFYFLKIYPENSFLNFVIYGGHYWNEYLTTISIMIVFFLYLLYLNIQRCIKK